MTCPQLSIQLIFRIQFFGAFGTETVAEPDIRVAGYIGLNLSPYALVVAYFFTVGTYWDYSMKGIDGIDGLFQFFVQTFQFTFLLKTVLVGGKKEVKYLDAI